MFERDLGDGWKAAPTAGNSLGLYNRAGKFCGWVDNDSLCLVESSPQVPVEVLEAFSRANREWESSNA